MTDDFGWDDFGYMRVMPVMYFYGIVYWGVGLVFEEDHFVLADVYHEEVGNVKGDRT
jgi:hypothetical protein